MCKNTSRQDALGSTFSAWVYISGHRLWMRFSPKRSFSTATRLIANHRPIVVPALAVILSGASAAERSRRIPFRSLFPQTILPAKAILRLARQQRPGSLRMTGRAVSMRAVDDAVTESRDVIAPCGMMHRARQREHQFEHDLMRKLMRRMPLFARGSPRVRVA